MKNMVTKLKAFIIFLTINIQINNVLLLDKICNETSNKIEDVLPIIWTNLAWRNVHLKEFNLQTKADFHRKLINMSTIKSINLKISFSGHDKGLANDDSKLTLIFRCANDFNGFEYFISKRIPLTTMIIVSRTFLMDILLNYVKEIEMPTSFYIFDIERQVIFAWAATGTYSTHRTQKNFRLTLRLETIEQFNVFLTCL